MNRWRQLWRSLPISKWAVVLCTIVGVMELGRGQRLNALIDGALVTANVVFLYLLIRIERKA